MPKPDHIAQLLIDREAYRVCRLMPQREFVSFCRNRNINVSDERLRRLERVKLFYPVLRIYRFDITHKVEFLDLGNRYRDFGELRDDEVWTGDTRPELAGFDSANVSYEAGESMEMLGTRGQMSHSIRRRLTRTRTAMRLIFRSFRFSSSIVSQSY